MDQADLRWLRRCVELAGEAVGAGDFPFGSVLADGTGRLRAEDRSSIGSRPGTPSSSWPAGPRPTSPRPSVGTRPSRPPASTARCAPPPTPWVGLGRIVYAMSSTQLTTLLTDLGASASPVRPLPIQDVAPDTQVAGPAPSSSPRSPPCTAASAKGHPDSR